MNFGGSVDSVRPVRTSVVTADFTENGEQQGLGAWTNVSVDGHDYGSGLASVAALV